MMKKVKWTCSKFEIRVAHLGILGLKIELLALKVMQWPILLKGINSGHSNSKPHCSADILEWSNDHTLRLAVVDSVKPDGG